MDVSGDGARVDWDRERESSNRGRDASGIEGSSSLLDFSLSIVLPFPPILILSFFCAFSRQETILSPSHDPFFATHLFSNFGDLGASLATYVKDFQSKSLASNPSSIETVADMKRFVEEYPEFRKLGGNVSKHVALVGELSRIVERDGLLGVSEVEQSLASNESHTADLKVSFSLSRRGG